MSSESSNNDDDEVESDELSSSNDEYSSEEEEEEVDEDEKLPEIDIALWDAVDRNYAAMVQQALRTGANVNCTSRGTTPLMCACYQGFDEIVRILLNAGANPWRRNFMGSSAMFSAVEQGHLSTIEALIDHDKGLLEIEEVYGVTPLLRAIEYRKFEIGHFLLDRGANSLATTAYGSTTLMRACGRNADLRLARRLLAAGVAVESRDRRLRTALHHAADHHSVEIMRELITEHNANIFAVDNTRKTPFDVGACAFLIESYSNMLIQKHGRLALHAILGTAEYSFKTAYGFRPPQNPLRIRIPLGELTLQHFRTLLSTFCTLLSTLDAELIRNRDESGKLLIHIACQTNAPVEVLSLLSEIDPMTLQIADDSGALPMHSLCGSLAPAEYACVRFLVEQGGVGTLAARNRDGALPLHVLCGSSNPSLRIVQFLIQSFPASVAARTKAGQYPFMIAACNTSTASLSVVYELVRATPNLVVTR